MSATETKPETSLPRDRIRGRAGKIQEIAYRLQRGDGTFLDRQLLAIEKYAAEILEIAG